MRARVYNMLPRLFTRVAWLKLCSSHSFIVLLVGRRLKEREQDVCMVEALFFP